MRGDSLKRSARRADSLSVAVVDADEARGKETAVSLTGCGFPASSAAPAVARKAFAGLHAAVLAVERSSVLGAGARASREALLEAEEIAGLRGALGADLVIAWSASAGRAAKPRSGSSKWADEEASGLPDLVGRVSINAASSGESAFGDLALMRRSIEAARVAAHDLSQPLTTIVARSRLLLEAMNREEPDYRPVSIISQEADRLASTLERMNEALTPRRKA